MSPTSDWSDEEKAALRTALDRALDLTRQRTGHVMLAELLTAPADPAPRSVWDKLVRELEASSYGVEGLETYTWYVADARLGRTFRAPIPVPTTWVDDATDICAPIENWVDIDCDIVAREFGARLGWSEEHRVGAILAEPRREMRRPER